MGHPFDRMTCGVIFDSMVSAASYHGQGLADDVLVIARDWGFRSEEIRAPVTLWHGEADVTVPPQVGQSFADTIPGCRATFYPGEGHFYPHPPMVQAQNEEGLGEIGCQEPWLGIAFIPAQHEIG